MTQIPKFYVLKFLRIFRQIVKKNTEFPSMVSLVKTFKTLENAVYIINNKK